MTDTDTTAAEGGSMTDSVATVEGCGVSGGTGIVWGAVSASKRKARDSFGASLREKCHVRPNIANELAKGLEGVKIRSPPPSPQPEGSTLRKRRLQSRSPSFDGRFAAPPCAHTPSSEGGGCWGRAAAAAPSQPFDAGMQIQDEPMRSSAFVSVPVPASQLFPPGPHPALRRHNSCPAHLRGGLPRRVAQLRQEVDLPDSCRRHLARKKMRRIAPY